MTNEKYALLDTDFISKMHLIRKDEENHLIDRIMEMPNYHFYCHVQVRIELERHNIAGEPEWLEKALDEGQNLGELKTYVLFQMLYLKYGEKIYVFCSDDRNARNGIVSIGGARCISVLSSFLRLQKECNFKKERGRALHTIVS